MAQRPPKRDIYWPLASLGGSHEIRDFFPDEAEALGVLTILWTRQELALKSLFLQIIASKRPAFAEAIWDRQITHQARRDLLATALHTVKLTKRQTAFLDFILERTKAVADRRNELIHAEYVVHSKTETLHAKIKTPRSHKPPKHQRASIEDLNIVIADLDKLLGVTEAAWMEFQTRKTRDLQKRLTSLAKRLPLLRGNPQSDYAPQSRHRKPGEAQGDPPQSSPE